MELAFAGLQQLLGAWTLERAEQLAAPQGNASPLEELDSARLERLRAQIAFARTRGSDTPPLLSAAAKL